MKHEQLFMKIAHTVAQMSHCERLKVGAVIVKDGNIISFGWNGTPHGFDNCCEDIAFDLATLVTRPDVVHAEQNALAKAARSTISTDGATLFLTHSPCFYCAKSIAQSGIKEVVFEELYREDGPIDFLVRAGVDVRWIHDKRI